MSKPQDNTPKKIPGGEKSLPDEPESLNKSELPNAKNIISVINFVSPKGNKYQIIKTNERDEYEEKPVEKKRKRRLRRRPPKD